MLASKYICNIKSVHIDSVAESYYMLKTSRNPLLTGRESELIAFAAEGKTDKVIAAELGISVGTVGTYWGRIRKKLHVNSRTEAVAIVLNSATWGSTHSQPRSESSGAGERQAHRELFDAHPDAIALCDESLDLSFTNAAFDELHTGQEMSSLKDLSIDGSVLQQIQSAITQSISSGKLNRILAWLPVSASDSNRQTAPQMREYRVAPVEPILGLPARAIVVIRDYSLNDQVLEQLSSNPNVTMR